jgi:drug/metabolite transporter (DMT)-like permease
MVTIFTNNRGYNFFVAESNLSSLSPVQGSPVLVKKQAARFALAALLAGTIATGFSPIFVRLTEVGPVATGFWRLGLALPVLWLWATFEPGPPPGQARPANGYRWLVAAGLCFIGDTALFNLSLEFTSVANASLLSNAAPLFVALVAWLFLGERFSPTFVVGLALALAGATILVGTSFSLGLTYLFGDLLGILTAMFYAGYILSIKQLRRDFTVARAMALSGLVTCAGLLIISLAAGETVLAVSLQGWLVLLGFALVSHVSGQGLIAYALAHLPASFSSVGLLLQPVAAVLLGWFILAEPVGFWQASGGIIVLAGIFLARRGSR